MLANVQEMPEAVREFVRARNQVRRMFAAIGNHVVRLHRDRIGALDLPEDLPAGEYRLMTEADIAGIFSSPT